VAGIRLVTELLTASGLFDRLARRVVWWSGGNQARLLAGLCLLTYALSLCLNNLATIMVVVPLTLRLADALELDPVPLVLTEVIASNLGGASTMVGDFPNMLIADVTGTPFSEFLIHLLPVCLLQLVLLLWLFTRVRPPGPSLVARARLALEALRPRPYDEVAAKRGKLILGGMVLGFIIGGWLGVTPGIVSLVAGHLALFAGGIPWRRLVRRDSFDDVLFFACLFLMVGAVEASGILEGPGHELFRLWRDHPRLGAVALAWGAALLTAVLSAGPTTALLLHLLPAGTGAGAPALWALSLGVCAGSSATLTGATAGPVAASLLERQGHQLTFNRFARTGLPVLLLLLLVSSVYLALAA
jgi:Na+/H+ antiporter NhaD/arsenite permease-like protein